MNIIFDLDGTLIDSKMRLFKLFSHLVPHSSLTYDSYWDLKLRDISNLEILKKLYSFTSIQLDEFNENWMLLIEDPKYLKFDEPIEGVFDYLKALKNKNTLFVCTARQFEDRANEQLVALRLSSFFQGVFVTEQSMSKEQLISDNINISNSDWIIGDTGNDIKVGHILGINSCAVLTGFLSIDVLKKYEPKLLVNSIIDFKLD